MKIATGSIAMTMSALVAALMLGAAGAADAQQPNNAGGGLPGAQAGSSNDTRASPGTGLHVSPAPMPGTGTSAGATGSVGSGPALNTMRANGTALYMNPDPRAPNVTGRAAPRR